MVVADLNENLFYEIELNTTENTVLLNNTEDEDDCNFLYGDGALRPCNDNQHCHIYCSDTSTSCTVQQIDALYAPSLSLDCIGDDICMAKKTLVKFQLKYFVHLRGSYQILNMALQMLLMSTVFGIHLIASQNDTHSMLRSSNSSDGYIGTHVNCETDHCLFLCDSPGNVSPLSGCFGTTFTAYNRSSITIQCDKEKSCRSILVVIRNTSNVQIRCADAFKACATMNVNVFGTNSIVNISCTNGSGICKQANINIDSNGTSSTFIQCRGDAACYRSHILLNSESAHIVVEGEESIYDTEIHAQNVSTGFVHLEMDSLLKISKHFRISVKFSIRKHLDYVLTFKFTCKAS